MGMSNPLLRPGDPRFVKPSIHDAQGKNLFAEPGEKQEVTLLPSEAGSPASPSPDTNVYAPSAESVPYQPRYVVSQKHRGVLLLVLALTGLLGSFVGVTSLLGIFVLGWVLSALAVVPAGCAWALGAQDLRSIRLGAMDPAGLNLTRVATWLGALGLLSSIAMVGTVIFFAIYFVMSLV